MIHHRTTHVAVPFKTLWDSRLSLTDKGLLCIIDSVIDRQGIVSVRELLNILTAGSCAESINIEELFLKLDYYEELGHLNLRPPTD